MKIINVIQAIAASIILTACVSVPPPQQPIKVNLGDSYEIYRAPLLDQTNHTLQHLNQNKDILYSQTYGGGGAGVGLLLGPLGVAANIKAIESKLSDDIDLYYTDWRENVMERGGEEFSPSFGQYCKMRRRQDSP